MAHILKKPKENPQHIQYCITKVNKNIPDPAAIYLKKIRYMRDL